MEVAFRSRCVVRLYRIADGRHTIWDGTGAAFVGGRWNSVGRQVIYASISYSCAMLEILAHAGTGRIPRQQQFVYVDIPEGISTETWDADALPPGWDSAEGSVARAFGDQWVAEARSAILLIPSVIARVDWNAVINPAHPHAHRLLPSLPQDVIWDNRLFKQG